MIMDSDIVISSIISKSAHTHTPNPVATMQHGVQVYLVVHGQVLQDMTQTSPKSWLYGLKRSVSTMVFTDQTLMI